MPWIWTVIALNVVATIVLTLHPLRAKPAALYAACATLTKHSPGAKRGPLPRS